MKKILLILLLIVGCSIFVGCSVENKPNNEDNNLGEIIDNNKEDNKKEDENKQELEQIKKLEEEKKQLLIFLKEEKKEEITDFEQIIKSEISDSELTNKINSLFVKYYNELDLVEKINQVTPLTTKLRNDVYALIPKANQVLDFNGIDNESVERSQTLLDNYLYRTQLIGIPIAPYEIMQLNALNEEKWQELFGKNGVIIESEAWDLKPYLSNEYFLNGMRLSLNKLSFFLRYHSYTPVENRYNIDYQKYRFYEQDIEKAKKYFRIALEEMIENGIYERNKDEVIELKIEISVPNINNVRDGMNSFIKQISDVFNCEEVTTNNFKLSFDFYLPERFTMILLKCLDQ